MSSRPRLPLCTLAVLASALAADASASISTGLLLDRGALQGGQIWRLWTGHLVHELPLVALADLSVLSILGAWIERRSRRVLGAVLAAGALLSSLALLLLTDFERTVGSSGVGCGLLTAAIVLAYRDGKRTLALVAAALFATKLALELAGLSPAALGGLPPGYALASAVHMGGALGGGLIAGFCGARARHTTSAEAAV